MTRTSRRRTAAEPQKDGFALLLATCRRLRFSDQICFDKRFKAAFGRTPKAFRTATTGGENRPRK